MPRVTLPTSSSRPKTVPENPPLKAKTPKNIRHGASGRNVKKVISSANKTMPDAAESKEQLDRAEKERRQRVGRALLTIGDHKFLNLVQQGKNPFSQAITAYQNKFRDALVNPDGHTLYDATQFIESNLSSLQDGSRIFHNEQERERLIAQFNAQSKATNQTAAKVTVQKILDYFDSFKSLENPNFQGACSTIVHIRSLHAATGTSIAEHILKSCDLEIPQIKTASKK